jgi:signal transduction histidine kinase
MFLLSCAVLVTLTFFLVRAALPSSGAESAAIQAGVAAPGVQRPSPQQPSPLDPATGLPWATGGGTGAGPAGSGSGAGLTVAGAAGAPAAGPPDGSVRGSLTVVRAVRDYRGHVLRELMIQAGIAIGATLVLAVGLGWLVAERGLRPVRTVVATARRLGADNLTGDRQARIRLTGPRDELTELADTFDAMLDRLAAAFDSQRRFVAHASHELRTPLAAQRTLVEVAMARPDPDPALTELGERLLVMNTRTEALIEGLLLLARGEAGLAVREVVCLEEIVATVLAGQEGPAARAGVELRWIGPDGAGPDGAGLDGAGLDGAGLDGAGPDGAGLDGAGLDGPGGHLVRGDPTLLERMLANLVDNAIKYNHPGGTVWVRHGGQPATRPKRPGERAEPPFAEDGQLVLSVANTGPPVPRAAMPQLFEPFNRAGRGREPAARGAGLGLSIVAAIARAHGGSVAARPRPDGGLELAVALPS